MFWKKGGSPESAQEPQDRTGESPFVTFTDTSSASSPNQQYMALPTLAEIDTSPEDLPLIKLPKSPTSPKASRRLAQSKETTPTDPRCVAQRRFFSSSDVALSRARNLVVVGKEDEEMSAYLPEKTAAFRLSATFEDCSTGHYCIHWKVKALKEFSIPNGLHFFVNVLYEKEPDMTGSLDVIMPANKIVQDQWFNLTLEEKLVIQPHDGYANVQVMLCNNENINRDEYFGLIIEHVELRPIILRAESQTGVRNFIVHRAGIPTFVIDTKKLRPNVEDSSYVPSSVPITRLATSKSSRFLASLALASDSAHITVWDMGLIKNPASGSRNVPKLYKSCAVATIYHPGISKLAIGLSISASGDQLAVYQEPQIGDWLNGSNVPKATFPFTLYNNPLVPQLSLHLDIDGPSTGNVEETYLARQDGETSTGENTNYQATEAPSSSPGNAVMLQMVERENELLQAFVGYGDFVPEMKKSAWEKDDVNSSLTSNVDTKEGSVGDNFKIRDKNGAQMPLVTMFVACNGLYLDVYEISPEKKWKRIHTITLTDLIPTLSRRITCKMMMESISNGTFMWLEDGGRSCTIWNLHTGSNITHISSVENARFKGSTFRGHNKMAISPHESIVALASVDGTLATYFANTGMAIDDRKFPGYKIEHVGFYHQDDQLFVILRDSATYQLSAWILDTLQLKSETLVNQVPIPTIGRTILSFFNAKGFWNRGLICEADGTKINCYNSYQPQGSKLIKTSPSVLKSDPQDVAYESLIDDHIEYRLLTAIHKEPLPEGDGLSYWVHRVEVREVNVLNGAENIIFSFIPEPWMRATTSEVAHPDELLTAFFVPGGDRFAVNGVQTLQIWNLPTHDNNKCTLQFFWSLPKDEEDREFLPRGTSYKSERVKDYYRDTLSTSIYIDIETGITTAEIRMNDKQKKKTVTIPGPGTIGARYAILHCFRSVHLLAAAYAFADREGQNISMYSPHHTLTFEDHAQAIVRFTREHINRMMTRHVLWPQKRAPGPPKSNQQRKPDQYNAITTNVKSTGRVDKEVPDGMIDNNKDGAGPGNPDTRDRVDSVGLHLLSGLFEDSGKPPEPPKPRPIFHPAVVTVMTLLLDHPYLQNDNHIFVEGILDTDNGDWIPRDNKTLNPIKRAIESKNGLLVEAFIEYCIKNAKKYHPAYLMPAVQCLNELSGRYPAMLANMFRKASYVPVHNSDYVAKHAIIANPQYGKWLESKLMFWRIFTGRSFEKSNNINDYIKPVFSLRSQLPFRASSFLNILSIETSVRENRDGKFPAKVDGVEEEKKLQSPYSHKIYVSPFPKLSMYGAYRPWYKEAKSLKTAFDPPRSAFTDIAGQDFFDSPAMVAMLEFKWNKFGFTYWLTRFIVVFIFFLFTVIITAQQIAINPRSTDEIDDDLTLEERNLESWRPMFRITICLGLSLIAYELTQFISSPRKYIKSPYNYLDLAAYVMPVAGCYIFLSFDPESDAGPDQIWIMSFAILALYMNVLFELRVVKQLGIVVNIILNITRRIVWFFLIFGLFLISFTHALLHLLHTRKQCTAEDCVTGELFVDEFPKEFWGALSTTYFFLAGRFEPVDSIFENGGIGFHIMMVIFFFFTVILLLNILIALMNDAFNESRDEGQLAWLKQWSEVIAEVEIFLMMPSERQNRNYFPDYIYYGANEQEAEMYESKFHIASKSNLSLENRFITESVSAEQIVTQRLVRREVQTLAKEVDALKYTQTQIQKDIGLLAELMASYLKKTTTLEPTIPTTEVECSSPTESITDSVQMSPTSSVEHDPPTSAKTEGSGAEHVAIPAVISVPSAPVPPPPAAPEPSATAPVSVPISAPAPAAPNRRVFKHRPKVGESTIVVESPTAYTSPAVHFDTPQSSTTPPLSVPPAHAGTMPTQHPSSEPIYTPEPAIPPRPSATLPSTSSSAPYSRVQDPESKGVLRNKGSNSSLKRRLQQKIAAVHTMDDVLKSRQRLEENNASHPVYVNPPAPRRDSEDEEEGEVDEENDDHDQDDGGDYGRGDGPSTLSTAEAHRPLQHHQRHHQHHHQQSSRGALQRSRSEMLVMSIPREMTPQQGHPPHQSPPSPTLIRASTSFDPSYSSPTTPRV
ncbi:hypothetical protein BG011_002917 [Mortierella polycephala]|uniref:Ion transport domain-containing protein n=1 Tax=Mortierella polycephala TaxID=41804 RepID=A0A9P6UBI5_9FUNG|nr:hypothetical protein BG011_002917 [Mortierella polycephala]